MSLPKEQQPIYLFIFLLQIIFMTSLVASVPTLNFTGYDYDGGSIYLGVTYAIPCFMGVLGFIFAGFLAFFIMKHPDLELPQVGKMVALIAQGVAVLFTFLCSWLVLWSGASIAVPWLAYFLCIIPAVVSGFIVLGVLDFIKNVLNGTSGGAQKQNSDNNNSTAGFNNNNSNVQTTNNTQPNAQQNYQAYGQNNDSNPQQFQQTPPPQNNANLSNDNNLQQNLNVQPQQEYLDPYQKEPTL